MKPIKFFDINSPFSINFPLTANLSFKDEIFILKRVLGEINGEYISKQYKFSLFYDSIDNCYSLKLINKEDSNDIIYKKIRYYDYGNVGIVGEKNEVNLKNIISSFLDIVFNDLSNLYSIHNSDVVTNENIINSIKEITTTTKLTFNLTFNKRVSPIFSNSGEILKIFKSIDLKDFPLTLNEFNSKNNEFNFMEYLNYKNKLLEIDKNKLHKYIMSSLILNGKDMKENLTKIIKYYFEFFEIFYCIGKTPTNEMHKILSKKITNYEYINLKVAILIYVFEQNIIVPLINKYVFDIIDEHFYYTRDFDTLQNTETNHLLKTLYDCGINEIITSTILNLFNYYFMCYYENDKITNYSNNLELINRDWSNNYDGFYTKEFNLTGNTFILKMMDDLIPKSYLYNLVYKFDLKNSDYLNSLVYSPLIIDSILNYEQVKTSKLKEQNIYLTKQNFDKMINLFINELMFKNGNPENYFMTSNQNINFEKSTNLFSQSRIILFVLLYINEYVIYNSNTDYSWQSADFNLTNIYLNIINNQSKIYEIVKQDLDEYYKFILDLYEKNSNYDFLNNISLFIVLYNIMNETRKLNIKSLEFDLFVSSLLNIINPYFKIENNIKTFYESAIQKKPKLNSNDFNSDVESKINEYEQQEFIIKYNINSKILEILLQLILLLNNINCLETLTYLFNDNSYEYYLNYNAEDFQNKVLNYNHEEICTTLFDSDYLSNFRNNFKNNELVINSDFIYNIKSSDINLPFYSNAMIAEHKEKSKDSFGRMFFDIEDIPNDHSNHFYNDIIIYINMLIDDLCEVTNLSLNDKEIMKDKCHKEFIVTSNTSSAHGISYHVYLPLKCNYCSLKNFLSKRKEEFLNSNLKKVKPNIECVYDFVDPLVYSETTTNIRISFYGKGNLYLGRFNLDQELSSNGSIKELIEFKDWLKLIEEFNFDDLYENINSLHKHNLNELQNLFKIDNIYNFFETINDEFVEINKELQSKNELNLSVMYKKRNLILMFMVQNLLTKSNLNTRILQKPFNMHLIYKTGYQLIEDIRKQIIDKSITNLEEQKNNCLKEIIKSTLITNTENCLEWDCNDSQNVNWDNFINNSDSRYFSKISNISLQNTNCNIPGERSFNENDFEFYIEA